MTGRPVKARSSAARLGGVAATLAVARKELFEGFRDRQTLIYTFVLPLCMYPALFWLMVQGFLVFQGQKSVKDVRVAVVAAEELRDDVLDAIGTPEAESDGGTTASAGGRVTAFELESVDAATFDEAGARAAFEASDEPPDAVLVLRGGTADAAPAELYYDSTESRSQIARERVAASLRSWADELRARTAEARDVDPRALDPITVTIRGVAEKKDQGAKALSMMLPMLMVVMCVLGAFFPAVDLTAGEKERGTAETTMLLPVPRTSVHVGKIVAVCAGAMIATVLNIVAIGLSAQHLLDQLSAASSDSISVVFPFGALLSITPLAALFAFFVAASLTGVASLAASFKEGQALLGPVQMLFILPAMAASLPGLALDGTTAWIPVVNVALAFREMLVGEAAGGPLVLCMFALVLYAALAIVFSVRLLSNESVSLAGETLSLRRIAGLLRGSR